MAEWIKEPPLFDPQPLDPDIHHLDGVPWWEAPLPHRLHRCKPQTRGWISLRLIERCACGASRFDGHGYWGERNSDRGPRDVPTESYMVRKQREADQHAEQMARLRARLRGDG